MPDLGNSTVFNQADASNASGTMPSWSGAAAPSTLDDAGRALQGAVTREWNWRSYTLTAGGTADAKTLTYSVAPAAYYNGQRFAFIANTTNTTSATLNVNSLGAKVIKKVVSGVLTNLSSGDMVSGAFVEVAYNTANDCFVWTGAADSPYFTSIELGNASDTTITRSAAGVIAVEGGVVPKENRANTFSADQTFSGAAIVGNATDQFKASVSGSTTTAQFGAPTSGGHFRIAYDRAGGSATFRIGTIASPVDYMGVDPSGNVGIGTASPGGRLDVSTADDGPMYFRNTTAMLRFRPYVTSYTSSQIAALNAAGSAYAPLAVGGSITTLESGGTERLRVDASGNVGIGGASTGSKLHVNEGDISAVKSTGIAQLTLSSGTVNSYLNANSGGVGTVGTQSNHQLWLMTNNTQRAILGTDGTFVLTSSGGLGYGTGSGGTVTQATSKSTGVTLNKTNGQIVTSNAAMTSSAEVTFTVTNSTVAATDTIVLHRASGGGAGSNGYLVYVDSVSAGSFTVYIKNLSSVSRSDAITLNFAVLKATTS